MGVRGKEGAERTVTLSVPDPDARHKLTEPYQLFRGLGLQLYAPVRPAFLEGVTAGGPAAEAGFLPGDLVIALDRKPVHSFDDFADYVRARPNQEILVTARRNGAEFSHRVKTVSALDNGKTVGRLMVAGPGPEDMERFVPEEMSTRSSPGALPSLAAAVSKSWQMTVAQAKFFVRMLTGQVSTKNISGFIKIAEYAGDYSRAGPSSFLQFLVLLSLSLGFLNLLPIPILDGGQIVFQIAEWAKGGPLSERTYLVGQQAGLLLLVLLMGVALFNDLTGLFGNHI